MHSLGTRVLIAGVFFLTFSFVWLMGKAMSSPPVTPRERLWGVLGNGIVGITILVFATVLLLRY